MVRLCCLAFRLLLLSLTINTHGDWGKVSDGPSAAPMSHNLTDQSPAVLSVKPAVEDVDAGNFLAFLSAMLKTESNSTPKK